MVHILPAEQKRLDHGNNSFISEPPTEVPQGSVVHKISKGLTFHYYFCHAKANDSEHLHLPPLDYQTLLKTKRLESFLDE